MKLNNFMFFIMYSIRKSYIIYLFDPWRASILLPNENHGSSHVLQIVTAVTSSSAWHLLRVLGYNYRDMPW